jgi:choline dehydrogenase
MSVVTQTNDRQYTVGPNNGEIAPGANVTTDAQIEEFIRNTAVSVAHQSGTAAMLPSGEGVVSPSLEVYGVRGLRIIDASIFPLFVDQHPQAAVYMVAEKGAQMIKEKHKKDI